MQCPQCGSVIRDDAKFCTICGYKIQKNVGKQEPIQEELPEVPVQEIPQLKPVQEIPQLKPVQKLPEAEDYPGDRNDDEDVMRFSMGESRPKPFIPAIKPVVEVKLQDMPVMAATWKCPTCGADVRETAKFCAACGTKRPEPLQEPHPEVQQPVIRQAVPNDTPRMAAAPMAANVRNDADMGWKCPRCGAQVRAGAKFCALCGTPRPQAEVLPEPQRQIVEPYKETVPPVPPVPPVRPVMNPVPDYNVHAYEEEPKQKRLKKSVIIGCIAAAVLIIAAIVLIIVLGKDKKEDVADSDNAVVQEQDPASSESDNSMEESSDTSVVEEESEEEITEESSVEESSVEESSEPEVDPNAEVRAEIEEMLTELDGFEVATNFEAEEALYFMLKDTIKEQYDSGNYEEALATISMMQVFMDAVNGYGVEDLEVVSTEWDGSGKVTMEVKISNASANMLYNDGFVISESAAGTTIYNEVKGTDISVSMPEQKIQYVSVNALGSGNSMYSDIMEACVTAKENEAAYVVAVTDGPDTNSQATVVDVMDAARNHDVKVIVIGVGGNVDVLSCRDIANTTNGLYLEAADESEKDQILENIGNYMERTYILEYTSIFTGDALKDASVSVGYMGSDAYARIETAYADILKDKEEDTEGEFIFPESAERYLTDEEVSALSKEELRIARNEIYARKGRLFKDEGLQSYFDSKSWYEGTISPDAFSNSMLNKYELANIELIQSYE